MPQALAAAGLEARRPRLRAGGRRRLCRAVRGAGRASACRCRKGLSDVEAASLPETFFTVWQNVFDRARLQRGETLLVQGGSSGIGVTAIQLAKAFGATVIVTAGSDEKCAACVALGADHAINYKTQDFVAEVKRLTGGARRRRRARHGGRRLRGARGRVPGRGRPHRRSSRCRAAPRAQLDAGAVLRKRLAITGSTLRPRPVAFKTAIARALREQVWPLIEAGTRQAGDPPGVPGRRRRRRRMR